MIGPLLGLLYSWLRCRCGWHKWGSPHVVEGRLTVVCMECLDSSAGVEVPPPAEELRLASASA